MNRIGFLGGTDAKRIMDKDWQNLWLEKTGRAEPVDLSQVFKVQLGIYTEVFHADWLRDKHGLELAELTEPLKHGDYPFLHGNPDRWLTERNTFLDLKHSNERATARSITEMYLPQMSHYCLCAYTNVAYVSTIPGNDEPFITKIEPPQSYLDELLDLELRFWWHVQNDVKPDIVPTATIDQAKELGKAVKVDGMRYVDMTGNNQWATLAGTVIETKAARDLHERTKDELKQLVEADVAEASGHGVTIKRDKRGSLRITMSEEAAE